MVYLFVQIIGVTGLSGSGKTTWCAKQNGEHIEVDRFVYAVLDEADFIDAVVKLLGTDIFVVKGKTDKRKLGEIVFASDADTIFQYNKLVWNFVEPRMHTAIASARKTGRDIFIDYLFLTHPLAGLWELCTKKVLITRDDNKRLMAVAKRDGATVDYIRARDTAFPFTFNEKEFDTVIRVDV